jgi:fucose 4-O-acetylase-like acetyltransferase
VPGVRATESGAAVQAGPKAGRRAPSEAAPVRERDVRLDVLKALAIVLVIFGHAVNLVYGKAVRAPFWLGVIFSVVAAVNVPLFMFVSGYLARRRPDLKWLGQRAMRLLVPLAAWSILVWITFFRAQGLGWFVPLVSMPYENGLWFLYVLFELCVLYTVLARSRVAMLLAVAACLVVPLDTRVYGLWLIGSQLPVFIAGRFAADRERFEPAWWVLPLAGVLFLVMWTTPGFNPMYAVPGWAAALQPYTAGWWIDPVMIVVRTGRLALELSLVASAFWLVRNFRHGAWVGALTLGMYASHQFFLPRWMARAGEPLDVLLAFVITTVGAAGTALILERSQTTAFLFSGSGRLPDWVRGRGGARSKAPPAA